MFKINTVRAYKSEIDAVNKKYDAMFASLDKATSAALRVDGESEIARMSALKSVDASYKSAKTAEVQAIKLKYGV